MAAPIIEEGFFLEGVEGTLKKEAKGDIWNFIPSESVETAYHRIFPAGEPAALLPCSVLEQMAGLAGDDNTLRVQLWALFTVYNEKNFLFSVYFLPLDEKAASAQKPADTKKPDPTEEKDAAPKTDSIIPVEILKQITSQKTPDLKKFEQIAKVSGDINLIGRSGYLTERNGVRYFEIYGLGLKVENDRFFLLPNSERAKAEGMMAHTPGRQRYNVSGLVTTYKGKTYMLLRRATRTFSHGNFSD